MVSNVSAREMKLILKDEGKLLIDYGYKWIAKYDSFIRKESYGHSVISLSVIDYDPQFIIIPHFSFSSKKVNAILDDVMQLKSDAVSDSIILNLGHFGMQEEFKVSGKESSLSDIKGIINILIGKVIPLFDSIQSDSDIGKYIASQGGDISNVFSYMNAIAQHYEMLQHNHYADPDEYFSPFHKQEHDMCYIERYLSRINR